VDHWTVRSSGQRGLALSGVGQVFEDGQQARVVELAPAVLDGCAHQVLHDRRGGRRDAGLVRELQSVAQVLEVEPEAEPGLVGEVPVAAPSAASSALTAGLWSSTVMAYPAARRWRAIGRPMIPRPMKPIVGRAILGALSALMARR
jgi:hypothetical protein